MRNLKDIIGGDIRILFAHLLVMSMMKRGNATKYWSNFDITKLDFFGKYLSRNSYQMLISNFHCTPDFPNPPNGRPGHGPLHKIRPLVKMCQDNFHLNTDLGGFYLLMRGVADSEGGPNF